MNLVERLLNRMAPAYRAATGPEGPLTTPPARTPADRDVLHYSTVFRAVQILETSIAGLPLRQLRDGVEIGYIGELHPEWVQKYELPQAPVVFEVDCAAVTAGNRPSATACSTWRRSAFTPGAL